MKLNSTLEAPVQAAPAKMFDGRFFISNPYDQDYTCKWNGSEYTFKAMSTSPLFIPEANPLETENIRKKFAIEMGTAAFMRSSEYAKMSGMEQKTKGAGVPTYVPVMKKDASGREVWNDASPVTPYVLRCLEPLPVVEVKITKKSKKDPELKINPKTGKPVISLMSHDENENRSLIEEAANIS